MASNARHASKGIGIVRSYALRARYLEFRRSSFPPPASRGVFGMPHNVPTPGHGASRPERRDRLGMKKRSPSRPSSRVVPASSAKKHSGYVVASVRSEEAPTESEAHAHDVAWGGGCEDDDFWSGMVYGSTGGAGHGHGGPGL